MIEQRSGGLEVFPSHDFQQGCLVAVPLVKVRISTEIEQDFDRLGAIIFHGECQWSEPLILSICIGSFSKEQLHALGIPVVSRRVKISVSPLSLFSLHSR